MFKRVRHKAWFKTIVFVGLAGYVVALTLSFFLRKDLVASVDVQSTDTAFFVEAGSDRSEIVDLLSYDLDLSTLTLEGFSSISLSIQRIIDEDQAQKQTSPARIFIEPIDDHAAITFAHSVSLQRLSMRPGRYIEILRNHQVLSVSLAPSPPKNDGLSGVFVVDSTFHVVLRGCIVRSKDGNELLNTSAQPGALEILPPPLGSDIEFHLNEEGSMLMELDILEPQTLMSDLTIRHASFYKLSQNDKLVSSTESSSVTLLRNGKPTMCGEGCEFTLKPEVVTLDRLILNEGLLDTRLISEFSSIVPTKYNERQEEVLPRYMNYLLDRYPLPLLAICLGLPAAFFSPIKEYLKVLFGNKPEQQNDSS